MISGYAVNDMDTYPLEHNGVKLLVDVDFTDRLAIIWFPLDIPNGTFAVGGFSLSCSCEEMADEMKKAFITAARIVEEYNVQ